VDIKEYISSGILEAYVLGALTGQERAEVEAAVSAHPELAVELQAIEDAMQHFVEEHAVTPPAHLQQQIWNTIQSETTTAEAKQPVIVPFPRKERSQQLHWQKAAVLIALVGSLIVNFFLWTDRNKYKDDQVAMQQQMDSLHKQQQALADAMTNYQHEKEMMANPGMQMVVMHTMQKEHPMAATIFVDTAKGDIYISVQKLPPPPQGMQYQLWVIQDNKPVDMGMISNDVVVASGMEKGHKLMNGAGQAFAVSLEKAGGSPVPTMERIYVMGKVSS
jgi:anti-sigma-K factor RskA